MILNHTSKGKYNIYLKGNSLKYVGTTSFENSTFQFDNSLITDEHTSIEIYQLDAPYSDNFSLKLEKNVFEINVKTINKINMVAVVIEVNIAGTYCINLFDSNLIIDNTKGFQNGSCLTSTNVANSNGKYELTFLVNDGVYTISKIRVYKNSTNGSYKDIDNYQINCPTNITTTQTPVTTTTASVNNCPVVNRVDIRFRYVGEGGGSGNQWAMDRLIGCKIQGSNDGINWNDLFVFTQSYVSTNFTSAQSGVLTPVNFSNTVQYKYVAFATNGNNGAYTYYDDLDLIKFYNGTTLLTGINSGTGGNWNNAFDNGVDTKWGIPDQNIYRVYTEFLCNSGGGGITTSLPSSSNILKTFSLVDIGGSWGFNEVLWADGSYHDHYWKFNRPNPPAPPSKTTLPLDHTAVSDVTKVRQIVDYWKSLGGDSISLPVYWDRTHYGATTYEFRQYMWMLNYAGSQGMKVGLWLKPNRQMGVDYYNQSVPVNNGWQDQTSSNWSFEPADAEHWSNGHLMSGPFDHRIALGSSKWNNYYDYVTQLALALEPYKQHILYFCLNGNQTIEEDLQMNDPLSDGTFNQATIARFNSWHLSKYGTPAPTMISNRTGNSPTLRKLVKFHSEIKAEKTHTVCDRIKAILPSVKVIAHFGSITDGANIIRGNALSMAYTDFNKMDGVKQNDERTDPAFQAKFAARTGKMNILETTNDPLAAPTVQDMIDNIKRCIDDGAVTGLSFAFFEGAEKANQAGATQQDIDRKAFLETAVANLKSTGYWTKNSNPVQPVQNPDVIQATASSVMNNGGSYINTYINTFLNSENNHGGYTPSFNVIDDL